MEVPRYEVTTRLQANTLNGVTTLSQPGPGPGPDAFLATWVLAYTDDEGLVIGYWSPKIGLPFQWTRCPQNWILL